MKKYLIMLFVALAAGFQSCDNNDDLWGAIDDLKSRVQALETQVKALNGNIEALGQLYSGATVSSVSQDAVTGAYTLKLSNGETVVLEQGSKAEAVIPQIGIDSESGEWQYSVDNGKTWKKLGVKAGATDGRTPQFRIDETTGYWQVRYADSEQFRNVEDTNGNPVSAVGSGTVTDKFFEKAELQGDEFYVKLLDGTELRVPVVKDFICRITAPAGVQTFDAGATKRFAVEMKGVANAVVTAPNGWDARLTETNELVVTAPGNVSRASADTSKDVAIQATSASGFSAIAKIQVESSGVAPMPPTVNVINSATTLPTASSLTFDVVVSANTDAWKYICQKSSEKTDPTAGTIATTGTAGSGASVTVADLESNTAYTIYVVAIKNDEPALYSDVASVENTTIEVVDLNDYYKSGVMVNGVRYDYQTENAKLVEVSAAATEHVNIAYGAGGTFFIDDKSDDFNAGNGSSQGIVQDVIVVGRYADTKTELRMGAYWSLRNTSATVAFKNLKINLVGVGNYAFNAAPNSAVNGAKALVFEDCEIAFDKTLLTMYSASPSAFVENIVFRNCKLRYEGTAGTLAFITLQNSTDQGLDGFKTLVFENNLLYSTKGAATPFAISLFMQDNAASTSLTGSLSNLAITCRNNTFVDFLSFGSVTGSAYFYVGKYGSVEFSKNLLYSARTDKYVSIMRVQYDYTTNSPWPMTNLARTDNIAYGTSGWKLFYDAAGSFKPEGTNTYTKLAESPLTTVDAANGRFVKDPAFADYGSTLE